MEGPGAVYGELSEFTASAPFREPSSMLIDWTPSLTTPTTPFRTVMPQQQRFMQFRYPLPYGAILREDGVQFVVYSRSATAIRVLLYNQLSDR